MNLGGPRESQKAPLENSDPIIYDIRLREKLITYLYVVDNISVCACYCLSKLKNPLIMSVLGRHISSRPTKKDIIKFVC